MYFCQKNLTRLRNNQATFFLDPKELAEVCSKLKKTDYAIYYPYKDSEKNILYNSKLPEILLYEIKTKVPVRHQDILGSVYSIGMTHEMFGDILIINGHYYIYILKLAINYFESNFLTIGNNPIELMNIDIDTLKDYERNYETLELIVSSNRIDTIVASICRIGRSNIIDMLKRKEIMLNYDFLKDSAYKLKENDIFSIKKIGKFKYIGIIKITKSNNYIIRILKYI